MADNVTVDNGGLTDYPVAADEVTYSGDTVLVQLLRLVGVTGAEGSKTVVPLDFTSDGLQRVEAHRDMVRISDQSAASELTISATSYTAGDQVGVMFQFPGAARANGGTGMIVGVSLLNLAASGDVIGGYDVVFFRSNVTLANNNDPFSINATAGADLIGVVNLMSAYDLGTARVAQAFNLAVPYDTGAGTTLFAALITRGTHGVFNAHTDLTMVVHVERN